jgi:hypothetical protein
LVFKKIIQQPRKISGFGLKNATANGGKKGGHFAASPQIKKENN